MASFFQDKNGNYHTSGSYLLVTFFGGVVSAFVLGFLTESLEGGIAGFFLYYVVKFIVKYLIKSNKEQKEQEDQLRKEKEARDIALEKSAGKVENINSYNDSVLATYKNNNKTLTPILNTLDFQGTGTANTVIMGTFFIPKDVTKIIVPYSTDYHYFATEKGYKLIIRKNGQIEKSQSQEEVVRMNTIDVQENDIISIELALTDGGFKGDLGIAYIN